MTTATPLPGIELIQGNSIRILEELPADHFDLVLTDPPYSSGGLFLAARQENTKQKYQHGTSKKHYGNFAGDNKDQRSLYRWLVHWLSDCFKLTVHGGTLLIFTDWRQLPLVTDAVQGAGWSWKGIVPWDKTQAVRPQRGFFRSQCEYVVTAIKGTKGREQDRHHGVCLPGLFRHNVKAHTKRHLTAKPVDLLKDLLEVVPQGSKILDPFAGSATTLEAAHAMGMQATGIEIDPVHYHAAVEYLSNLSK